MYDRLKKKSYSACAVRVFDHFLYIVDIPNVLPQGIECPSLLLLLITSPLPIPHPPSLLTSSSLCPLTVRSALCPILAVPPIKSPFSGVTVPFCLVALASFVLFLWLSFSHSGLDKSPLLAPCCILSSKSTSYFPSFFRPAHLWISFHISSPGDSTDTSARLTPQSSAADRHWCGCAARICRAAKAKGTGVKGHGLQSCRGHWGRKVSGGETSRLR